MRSILLPVLILSIMSCSTMCFADALMLEGPIQGDEYLPLLETNVEIEITDQVAITIIDHTFLLESEDSPDLTYFYPVPEGASITGLGIWIDDELNYFELEPGQQSGIGGDDLPYYLANYLGSNPFIQTFSEMDSGLIKIRLEYTELMNYEFGDYSLYYPLDHPDFFTCDVDTFNIQVHGQSQRLIEAVQVSPYTAEFELLTDYEFQFLVAGSGVPFANLTTLITVDQEDVGMWLMTYKQVDSLDPGFGLVVLEPGEVAPSEIIQKNFTFVIDKSGSMNGQPMQEAKEAAIYCITHLNSDDFFNIIAFDGNVYAWQQNPIPATENNIDAATDFINSLNASGSTNFNDAVLQALEQDAPPYRANQILVLSDGQPTAGETDLPDILENIDQANTINASIFTIAAGNAAALDFLALIAMENAGLSLRVENLANLAEEIELFFLRFSSPVLTQVTLDMGEIEITEQYPPAPYSIFAGSQLLISGQYTQPGETMIELSASFAGVDTSITYGPFTFTDGDTTSFSFVPRMWAIQKIDYWLAWMAVYGEDQEIIDMIIELSLQYGILTEYTGFNTPVDEQYAITLNATRDHQAVYLSWSMTPAANVSFDVYRKETGGRAFLKLNNEPVRGGSYVDLTATSNVAYVYRVQVAEGDVHVSPAEVRVAAESGNLIANFTSSPNPFNANTRISFSLARTSDLKLVIFDVLGREVDVLLDGQLNPGQHSALFSG
ncbi:MAG TPA: VWA domain-containing protein, partial [Bacteroidetes bacterium]|nr:VWA domain-containing protein [Bacteroidota bacterium]HEX04822.1 VWA domain-containing protein [Bacteroidota bacterium]